MRAFTFSAAVLAVLVFSMSAQAASALNSDDCPERTSNLWCAPQLVKEGWTLKYRSQSSPQLMDVYWTHEIWIRERTALLCSHVGGRAGIRVNTCYTLDEVDR